MTIQEVVNNETAEARYCHHARLYHLFRCQPVKGVIPTRGRAVARGECWDHNISTLGHWIR